MPRAQKGQRFGGRIKGTKNRATIQREIEAAERVAQSRGKAKDAALTVLERLMQVAEGAAGLTRPASKREMAEGKAQNPDGDWELFGDWFDRAAFCAKELAKYQAPQIRAVEAPAPPPDPREVDAGNRRRFGLRVFEGGKPLMPPSDVAT